MPARVVICRDSYDERFSILEEALIAEGRMSNATLTEIAQQANREASALPFSVVATALANGDDKPARELCRREARLHGREWAERLRDAIKEAVEDARSLDTVRT